ncbi:UDP-N-acetylglucosamine 1-carboxyvinyltransferase [Candidatus Gottesmanbacteria bacterium]|nr:UDP-N-acetylglucosamine 1-carboxyvinyltransferase [Candidatus Gottesmanbacteria bacterium]
MDSFKITGGFSLNGEIKVGGAKNVAIKALIASLLTDEDVVIENVPLISDLYLLSDIVKSLGVKIDINNNHTMTINAKNLFPGELSPHIFSKLRASFLLIAPLLARFKEAKIPFPGGDDIGVRPIDRTISGLKSLGAKIEFREDHYLASCRELIGSKYYFNKNTHTGTEALMMAATLSYGETVLENAAAEPEVDELIKMLKSMGAKIKRTAERTIVIYGVKKLKGTHFKIIPDRNEIVTFAIAAILTRGELNIYPVIEAHLESFYQELSKIGVDFKQKNNILTVNGSKRPIFAGNIETAPYPLFMTDWQAPWCLLMTQAKGVSVVWEKVFENRFGYVNELKKMGAAIELFNPKIKNPNKIYNFNWKENLPFLSAAKIIGPTLLHGENLLIPDLRAGATLVLAAMAAQGESHILGVNHIDRGYEKFEERLNQVGAKITRLTVL